MQTFKHLFRITYIGFVLAKYGLVEIVRGHDSSYPLKFLQWFSLARWNGQSQKSRGVRIREALQTLGPIFVKFGQLLSTRYDIFPEDVLLELAQLQDNVPPFSGNLAQQIIEEALGSPIQEVFQHFDITPLASASIAQVHAATLLEGQEVVVKVLRPNIHQIIKRDVELLHILAKLSHRYGKKIRFFKPREIVTEFEKSLLNELDLMQEAANASQLKRNFLHSPILHIPEIYWQFAKHNILVMERIYGIPISNREALKQQGFDLPQLAKLMLEIFFTQVFRDRFFHADMHPGNILVAHTNLIPPTFLLIDFGIMGVLSQNDQYYLAENILAFLKRDYRRVAMLHLKAAWIPKETRLDEFEASIRTICEPIFSQPLKMISFGQFFLRLLQLTTRYQINIQPQFMLLQKTLIHLEGISRRLDPDIDLWETAKPFLENWMKNQIGIPSLIRKMKTHIPDWIENLPEFSHLLYNTLTQLTHAHHMEAVLTQSSLFSLKDICIGVLLGISLISLWLVARSYF